jgi:hypothetical protein
MPAYGTKPINKPPHRGEATQSQSEIDTGLEMNMHEEATPFAISKSIQVFS